METVKQAYQRALTVWLQHPVLAAADVALAVLLVVWAIH